MRPKRLYLITPFFFVFARFTVDLAEKASWYKGSFLFSAARKPPTDNNYYYFFFLKQLDKQELHLETTADTMNDGSASSMLPKAKGAQSAEAGKTEENSDGLSFHSVDETEKVDSMIDEEKDEPKQKLQDRFMVHDAFLYNEVLDASDWTDVLREEKRRKKLEAMAQHSEEEACERDRRDVMRRKAAEDAKAVKEARKKQEYLAREERDLLHFRERNDAFFARHQKLIDHWRPMERTHRAYVKRVRENIYRRWEREVYFPTQKEINRKVEAKCMDDSRPHLFKKKAKWALLDAQRSCSSGSFHFGDTPMPTVNDQQNGGSRSGEAGLTWKEKKDALWQSFLRESNRKSKIGGRGGLFLDVIDEVEYDPIAQRRADTIRYKKRTLPVSESDRHCEEAQVLDYQYSLLGLAYREQERMSRTGILRENAVKVPEAINCLPGAYYSGVNSPSDFTSSSNQISREKMAEEGYPCSSAHPSNAFGEEGTKRESAFSSWLAHASHGTASPAPPVYDAEVHRRHHIPHTYVPYDFGRQISRRKSALNRTASSSGGSKCNADDESGISGRFFSSGYQDDAPVKRMAPVPQAVASVPPVVDRTIALTCIAGEGSAAKAIHKVRSTWQEKKSAAEQKEYQQQMEDRHQSPLALAVLQEQTAMSHEKNLKVPKRVIMPLPLKPTPAPLSEDSRNLLPRMGASMAKEGMGAVVNERSHYLPVQKWGMSILNESIYGHYSNPDGSVRQPPVNKEEGGYRIHNSRVCFDHFNFPKENEEVRTGKRMCVYYQV